MLCCYVVYLLGWGGNKWCMKLNTNFKKFPEVSIGDKICVSSRLPDIIPGLILHSCRMSYRYVIFWAAERG